LVAKYLGLLDVGAMRMGAPATAGKTEDFWWAARQHGSVTSSPLNEDVAVGVLWTLFDYNIANMHLILPPDEMPNYPALAKELQMAIGTFKAEAQALEDTGDRPRAKAVPVLVEHECPTCHTALGKTPAPSRRGRRRCKSCGKDIVIDPKQSLYSSPFLTSNGGDLLDIFERLRDLCQARNRPLGGDFYHLGKGSNPDGVVHAALLARIKEVRTDIEGQRPRPVPDYVLEFEEEARQVRGTDPRLAAWLTSGATSRDSWLADERQRIADEQDSIASLTEDLSAIMP
jgi:hypothetical protein